MTDAIGVPGSTSFGIGIDVGGTFTDAVLVGDGTVRRAKVLTTPDEPGRGVMDVCRLLAAESGRTLPTLLGGVGRFSLSTTAVTNVLTSRTGRRLGLVTTAGFEDLLSIAKGRRLHRGGWVTLPDELVPRRRIRGVRERVDRNGEVRTPLATDELLAHVSDLVEKEGIEVLTLSFLWSFRNPVHEELASCAIAEVFPDLPVVAGALVNPVMRDYERMTFALMNAYTVGAFAGIDRLESELARAGLRVPLLLVDCAGGATTVTGAREMPISLVHSGPSGGVAAAAAVAQARGLAAVICCDMGGTSFDISIVADARASRTTRGELFGVMTALPTVDVESIGSGGGSLGWVDSRGVLRVGPRSAGSTPGPACYGRGGTEPTITDALLVLGYLDPANFLGGVMRLDTGASERACAELGRRLGLAAIEVAWGIREIALDSTVRATRAVIASRGLHRDRRSIVSYGGCGSLFTADIARRLGIEHVIVPEVASVFSAFGAVSADLRRERARSLGLAAPFDVTVIAKAADELIGAVRSDLEADGAPPDRHEVVVWADLRFRGQVAELSVPLTGTEVDEVVVETLLRDFQLEYARRFGNGAMVLSAGVELATLRAVASSPSTVTLTDRPGRSTPAAFTPDPSGSRLITLDRHAGPTAVAVYVIDDVSGGAVLTGPACLDGRDTTVWVPPGATAERESDGSFLVTVGGAR
jgi:N-methylhydantoinase A